MNTNIMKTQILHKIKYDLKGPHLCYGMGCGIFLFLSYYNLYLSYYGQLLFLFIVNLCTVGGLNFGNKAYFLDLKILK